MLPVGGQFLLFASTTCCPLKGNVAQFYVSSLILTYNLDLFLTFFFLFYTVLLISRQMLGLWRYPWHCLYQTLDLTFSPNRKHVQTQGNIVPNAFMSSCWRTALCIILSEQPFQRHMIHNPVQTEAAHDCHLNIYLFYNLFIYPFLVKFQNLKYKLGRGVNHKNCLLRLALIDAV